MILQKNWALWGVAAALAIVKVAQTHQCSGGRHADLSADERSRSQVATGGLHLAIPIVTLLGC